MSSERWISLVRERFGLFCLCVVLCLAATACFRDTAETIEQQPVAREVSSPTAVDTAEPAPTATAEPTEVIATEASPDTFALTATALIARLTQVAEPEVAEEAIEPDVVQGEATSAADLQAVQATAITLIRSTVPPGEDCIHEIRAGETLFMLSLAYGSTVDAIAAASDIANPDRIAVGQRITIPGCGTSGFAPPPTSLPPPTADPNAIEPTAEPESEVVAATSNDELSALVVQAQEAILSNAQASLADDFTALAAETATPTRTHTVQQGETLLVIALEYGTTIDALAALNNITDVDAVQAGDVLKIP